MNLSVLICIVLQYTCLSFHYKFIQSYYTTTQSIQINQHVPCQLSQSTHLGIQLYIIPSTLFFSIAIVIKIGKKICLKKLFKGDVIYQSLPHPQASNRPSDQVVRLELKTNSKKRWVKNICLCRGDLERGTTNCLLNRSLVRTTYAQI